MLALLFLFAVIAPLGSPQSLNAQLHNASATGNVQELANLVAKLRAANPRTYLSQLSNCYEGPPSDCTRDNSPTWCSAYSAFSSSDQDECLSVLHTAAKARQSGSIKFLTGVAGMDVDVLDKDNQTALHTAFNSFTVYWDPCTPDFRDTVFALLAAGANPNLPFHYGGLQNYTVLHFEAYDGNRHGLMADLVRAGANVNATDDRGYTPLHSAAKCDFRLSCDDCGCSTDFCADNPQTAACLTDLKNYPKNATVQFFGAAPTLKYLVAQGGNPNAAAKDGTKPINLVPAPPSGSLADSAKWVSGTCEKTYDYLKSVSA
ncbi:probable Ankyrin-3 [Coccomyxa sp. Obi]|nr:probable Ankyrin-3 [Coccomyxa sp. Obi]